MSNEYIVLGDFKGRFKTNQSVSLGLSETFPKDMEHKVQVYEGTLDDTKFESDFLPNNYRKLNSFLLTNVPNISIQGNVNTPFLDKRVYTFTQLMIINPEIIRTFEIKGQTYGELKGKAYGITEKSPQINRLDPPPIQIDAEENSGSVGSSDFNEESEIGQALNRAQSGCLSVAKGCWTNLWKIIFWILLLLFLWWLIRSCDSMAKDDVCDRRDQHRMELEREKKERDSLKLIYDENVRIALTNIKNIYFYQNSTEIHEYSLGDKGNMKRLIHLLQICDDKFFIIVGHHSGKDIEDSNIDKSRAELIKSNFITNGIISDHLSIINIGDKEAFYSKKMNNFLQPDYSIKRYNRNMRVEIKLKEK